MKCHVQHQDREAKSGRIVLYQADEATFYTKKRRQLVENVPDAEDASPRYHNQPTRFANFLEPN